MTTFSSQNVFATITGVSGVSSDTVGLAANNVNSLKVYWTDASTDDEPTDGALVTHYVEISDDGFVTVLQSVDAGNGVGVHTFNGLNPATVYDVQVIAEFVTAGNQTGVTSQGTTNTDSEDPVVTGSTTNVTDGGNTELTSTDQYTESCTATDNDTNFVDNCSVQSGSIDTSSLGLQSVTYVATDPSSNSGTDTVSTTVVDTTSPVFGGAIPSQNGQVNILFTDNESGVSVTDIQTVTISAELFAPNSTSIQTVADISIGTISFTPDVDGTWKITYTATDASSNTSTSDKDVIIATNGVPVISDSVGDESKSLNTVYSVTGFTATDLEDGTLTNSIDLVITSPSSVITNKVGSDQPFDITLDELGSWTITADVVDSDTNSALTVTRTVTVGIGDFPVLVINGNSQSFAYNAPEPSIPSATCDDTEDGNIDGNIIVTQSGGNPNTVTFSCTDSSGNTVEQSIVFTRLAHGGSGNDKWRNAPTYGVSLQTSGEQFVTNGFGYGKDMIKPQTINDNFWTHFNKVEIPTGVEYSVYAKGYFPDGLYVQEFCFGIPETGKGQDAESCVETYFDYGYGNDKKLTDVKVIQKTDVIEVVSTSHKMSSCSVDDNRESCDMVTLKLKFLEPLHYDVMMIKGIDHDRKSTQTYLNEGFHVSGEQFTELPSVMIPSPLKYEGLIKVTQSEKYSPVWISSDGRQFEINSYGSAIWINQQFDSTENHRVDPALREWATKEAVKHSSFDSSKIQGIDKGYFVYDFSAPDHREQTLQKLGWD